MVNWLGAIDRQCDRLTICYLISDLTGTINCDSNRLVYHIFFWRESDMLPVTERVADPKFRALGTSRGQERRPGPVPFPRCFFQFSLLISSNLCSFKSLLSDRKAASPNYLAQQLVYSLNCLFQSTYIQRTHTMDKITANTRSLCSPVLKIVCWNINI